MSSYWTKDDGARLARLVLKDNYYNAETGEVDSYHHLANRLIGSFPGKTNYALVGRIRTLLEMRKLQREIEMDEKKKTKLDNGNKEEIVEVSPSCPIIQEQVKKVDTNETELKGMHMIPLSVLEDAKKCIASKLETELTLFIEQSKLIEEKEEELKLMAQQNKERNEKCNSYRVKLDAITHELVCRKEQVGSIEKTLACLFKD